jgi:hypothetical protein
MITVYFETNAGAHRVAKLAVEQGYVVTESVNEEGEQ